MDSNRMIPPPQQASAESHIRTTSLLKLIRPIPAAIADGARRQFPSFRALWPGGGEPEPRLCR